MQLRPNSTAEKITISILRKLGIRGWIVKFLKIKSNCPKCNSPIQGTLLCDICQRYFDITSKKHKEEEEAKEEYKRRTWIISRDKFLGEYDAS